MEAELQQFFKEKNWTYIDITNETDLKTIYNLYIHNDTDFDKEDLSPLGLNYVGFYYGHITEGYEEMEKYYLMAIEGGNTVAMNNLGLYHEKMTKNYEEMEKYYLMAIEGGNTQAMINYTNYLRPNPDRIIKSLLKLRKELREAKQREEALENKNAELQEENIHLKYRPGGPGMEEAQEEFENLCQTQNGLKE